MRRAYNELLLNWFREANDLRQPRLPRPHAENELEGGDPRRIVGVGRSTHFVRRLKPDTERMDAPALRTTRRPAARFQQEMPDARARRFASDGNLARLVPRRYRKPRAPLPGRR